MHLCNSSSPRSALVALGPCLHSPSVLILRDSPTGILRLSKATGLDRGPAWSSPTQRHLSNGKGKRKQTLHKIWPFTTLRAQIELGQTSVTS